MSKVYKIITDKIIEQLDKGVVPWHKPWNTTTEHPRNFISKKGYSGINPFLLMTAGYQCPHWVTYKQAAQAGGNVKKGEHGSMIVFFKMLDGKDDDGEKRRFPILRYYNVFNLEQCEGIDYEKPDVETFEHEPIKACENIVKSYKGSPRIEHGSNRACYHPQLDYIDMPDMSAFPVVDEYYSTLFHELGHSTGHKERLNRDTLTASSFFGSHEYSKEELVAEFAACFLCGVAGIETATIDNSAAYIESWKRALKGNDKLVVQAAGKAQKAANLIQGIS